MRFEQVCKILGGSFTRRRMGEDVCYLPSDVVVYSVSDEYGKIKIHTNKGSFDIDDVRDVTVWTERIRKATIGSTDIIELSETPSRIVKEGMDLVIP